jgi:chaperone modulatory protein CbpM
MQNTEHDWLVSPHLVSQADLAAMCGVPAAELGELVEYGALAPLRPDPQQPMLFDAGCVPHLREAFRLRKDFDLELFAVGLLLGYLERIQELERQVRALQAQLPHTAELVREGPARWLEPHG